MVFVDAEPDTLRINLGIELLGCLVGITYFYYILGK